MDGIDIDISLAFLGLLGVLICLALLIARAIRQESPAREAIGLLACAAVFVVGCIGLNSLPAEPVADAPSDPLGDVQGTSGDTQEPADGIEAVENATDGATERIADRAAYARSESEDEKPQSLDDLCALIEETISGQFDGFSISNDGTDIKLAVWFDGLIETLHDGHYAGAGADDEDWMELKDNLVGLAVSMCDLIDTCGFEDTRLLFNVQNDLNPTERTLLSILDTTITFDLMDVEDWDSLL